MVICMARPGEAVSRVDKRGAASSLLTAPRAIPHDARAIGTARQADCEISLAQAASAK